MIHQLTINHSSTHIWLYVSTFSLTSQTTRFWSLTVLSRQFASVGKKLHKTCTVTPSRKNILIAHHEHDLQLLNQIITFLCGQESWLERPDIYFSLTLTPPTGNKEIWLAHEPSSMVDYFLSTSHNYHDGRQCVYVIAKCQSHQDTHILSHSYNLGLAQTLTTFPFFFHTL